LNLLKNNNFLTYNTEYDDIYKLLAQFTITRHYNYVSNIENVLNIINFICKIPLIRNQYFFLKFFEISQYSLDCVKDGFKPRELLIKKRSNTRKKSSFWVNALRVFKKWQKRWLVLKDDVICYLDSPYSNTARDVNLFLNNYF
jgi:hypothetical protein